MKSIIVAASLMAALSAAASVATVSNVAFSQNAAGKVSVTYHIDAPAVITVDIQTNRGDNVFVSIGAENVKTVWGDANRVIQAGDREILWAPRKDWPDHALAAGQVKAVVTAWALNATPDYMAVDLTMPSNVWYYVAAECVPGGVTNAKYKTEWLLLRKIPAQGVTWRMGIAPADASQDSVANRATAHLVQLSADYYIGVYPVTQKQYALIGGGYRKGAPSGDNAGDMKPAGGLDWGWIRSGSWPDNPAHSTAADAVLKFRRKAGIEFDLPTEAQWEFACRAGTGGCLYTGEAWNADNLGRIAWFSGNTTHLEDVGQKEPNAWGLYDMIGNIQETCLDFYADNYVTGENGAPIVDPVGAATGSQYATWPRSERGGGFDSGYADCASHRRGMCNARSDWVPTRFGFRLMAPMGGQW